MNPGGWTLLGTVGTSVPLGLVLRAREGKPRRPRRGGTLVERMPEQLRERLHSTAQQPDELTLLQLSSTFCAPCRHARILLDDFARRTAGVRHVEVDLTHHPEWSDSLGVHSTPTTLVLDPSGAELMRVPGVPKRTQLADALRPHLPARGPSSDER